MQTTQKKAVAAYLALSMMARKPMNSFAAFKLFRLKKALADIVEFQSDQEHKLVEELGGSITETGEILLEDKEKRAEYASRHRELEEMECEIDTKRIIMTMKELPDLSLADMEALDEFIEWRE
ncbi:MAG: hypothetical protein IKQ01_06565 [Bacteroidales bacterium]|nr:hypothetical protein [Bacteroidales bacterium]